MGRTSVILISLASLIKGQAADSAPALDDGTNRTLAISRPFTDDQVTDSWFFIAPGPTNIYQQSFFRSESSIVKVGQSFGFRSVFSTSKPAVKFKIELQVPANPENFKFRENGKVVSRTLGKRTVVVERFVGGIESTYAVFWGTSDKDPVGQYELRYFFGGRLTANYRFKVEK